MTASDQYQLDIGSVRTLIQDWQKGSAATAAIARQLSAIREQLERSIPSALVEGLFGEVPLTACFVKLADAVAAANGVAQGLTQDSSTLNANLAAYIEAETSAEAKLKAVKSAKPAKPAKGAGHRHHGPTTHHGGGGPSSGGGGNGLQPPGPARPGTRTRRS